MTINTYSTVAQLEGFLSLDAHMLFQHLGKIHTDRGALLEIGVFCGMSLLSLADAFPDAKEYVGVDPFFDDFTNSPALVGEGEYLTNASKSASRQERINKLMHVADELGVKRKIRLAEITQDEFLRQNKTKFGICHIDGEHTYQAVADFLDQMPQVMIKNSLVIVDDILNLGFPGIAEAVFRHKSFKKTLFPLVYAFNKGVFLYEPTVSTKDRYIKKISQEFESQEYIVRPLHDGSLMIYKDSPTVVVGSNPLGGIVRFLKSLVS